RQRDQQAGLAVASSDVDHLEQEIDRNRHTLQELEPGWQQQRELADRLLQLRRRCAARPQSDAAAHSPPAQPQAPALEQLSAELEQLQGQLQSIPVERRLASYEVSPRLVAEVISHWTGVPLSQLAREHSARVTGFADDLRQRIRGQEQAVVALDRAMR